MGLESACDFELADGICMDTTGSVVHVSVWIWKRGCPDSVNCRLREAIGVMLHDVMCESCYVCGAAQHWLSFMGVTCYTVDVRCTRGALHVDDEPRTDCNVIEL